MSLTVTTVSAMAEGTQFDIYLQVTDFEDASSNALVAGGGTYLGQNLPSYDFSQTLSNSGFVRLDLQTHQEAITSSLAVSSLSQIPEDVRGTDNFELLNSINTNFTDNDFSSTTTVSQLNDTSDGGVTGSRLQALGSAILSGGSIPASIETAPANVVVDRARVHFDIAEATTYHLSVKDADGISQTFSSGDVDLVGSNTSGLTVAGSGITDVVALTVDTSSFNGPTIEFVLDDISMNDVLTIESVSTFGTSIATASLTLVDQVAPTTVLQNSYGIASGTDDDG